MKTIADCMVYDKMLEADKDDAELASTLLSPTFTRGRSIVQSVTDDINSHINKGLDDKTLAVY